MSGLIVRELSSHGSTITIDPKARIKGRVVYPGSIVQTKMISSTAVQTISSLEPVAITGLTLDFKPIFPNSIIHVSAQIATNATYVSSFGVYKNGSPTVSTTGTTNSNQPNMQTTTYLFTPSTSTELMWSIPLFHREVAENTNNRTYTIVATSGWAGGVYGLSINNRGSADMGSASHVIIQEIAQ